MQAGQKKNELIGRESEQRISDIINTTFGINAAMKLEQKKEEIADAIKNASLETKEKLNEAAKEIEKAAHNIEDAIAETKKEARTTEPVESAGTFQMVFNMIASIFITLKDMIINAFDAAIAFFKNLFSSK